MRHTRIGLGLILGAALLASALNARAQGTLAFTMEATPAPSAGQVIPKLTWATTPVASGCTATGPANWAGTKAASGTQTLAAVTPPTSYTLRCNWPGGTSAVLHWTAPVQNTDGSPLANLAGYKVFWGTSATSLTQSAQVANPAATGHTVDALTAGTWHFAVLAYASSGAESDRTSTVSKTIAPPFEVTQSVGITVPKPPTAVTVE